MDNNMQNSSGMMNGMPPAPQTEKKVGPIVGALIIILILIIAALYFFGQKLNTDTANQEAVVPSESLTASVSGADDVDTLNAELQTQLNDVDYSF